MMNNIQIYNEKVPSINENVLVIFTSRTDSHFEGELVEFNQKCIMSYNDATKKKKIYNWNKVIPLNKIMVAKVYNIFDEVSLQVSTVAFEIKKKKNNEKDSSIKENNVIEKIIMKLMNDNKIIISQITKMCYETGIEFNDFWTKIIHSLDKLRRDDETIDINDCSLLDFYKSNFDKLEEIINTYYEDQTIIQILKNINIVEPKKFISKIGLISMNNINQTKKIIKNVIEQNNDWKYTFKYETAPYYILESLDNQEKHQEFIDLLKKEINNEEKKPFIGIEYVAKII